MSSPRPEGDGGVAERVYAVVVRCEDVDGASLTRDTRLVDDLGMDSLSQVELQMALEEESGVELPDGDVSALRTIGDVIEAVEAAFRGAERPVSAGGGAP